MLISRLVCKAKRNKQFLDELLAKRAQRTEHREQIGVAVNQLVVKDQFIDSVSSVKAVLPNDQHKDFSV